MNVENINIVDTAQPPLNPIKPRILMNIAVAFILGLLIAVGLAFVIEYFDDTVKSADDVERYLGLTVLVLFESLQKTRRIFEWLS